MFALVALGAAAGGVIVRGCVDDGRRAAEVERWRVRLDERDDSLRAFRARLAAALAEAAQLRVDSAARYAELAVANEAATAGVGTIRYLLSLLPDTAAAGRGRVALEDMLRAGEKCTETLRNCEQRAANADRRARDAEGQVDGLEADLDTTQTKWERAERDAAARWSLGATGGYALTAPPGGQVCAGPSLTIGLSYRLGRLRLPDFWPF